MRLLVIEDNRELADLMKEKLSGFGYVCDVAYDGENGDLKISDNDYDAVLLDLNLPDRDGFGLLEDWRDRGLSVPVLIVPARGELEQRVKGLRLGSDDYITKPFSPKELVLRVNNVIKRVYKNDNNRIQIDGYELDEEQRKVFAGSDEIDLTTKEFDLLMMFIKNKGIAFSRDKILENVWEENYYGSDRVVDDTLRRLRKKLPNLNIHTIYGYGYRLG